MSKPFTLPSLFLCLIILMACGSKKQEKKQPEKIIQEATFRLKLPKGKKYSLEMTLESKLKSEETKQTNSSNATYFFDYEVKDILPNNHFLIRITPKSSKVNGELMGSSYSYDSETDKTTGEFGETMAEATRQMMGTYTEVELDSMGKLVKLKASHEGPNKYCNTSIMHYVTFPGYKISTGNNWETALEQTIAEVRNKFSMKYTFQEIYNTGTAEIKLGGTFETISDQNVKVIGVISGIANVDTSTGLTTHTEFEQVGDMTVDVEGTSVAMKMTGKITIDIR